VTTRIDLWSAVRDARCPRCGERASLDARTCDGCGLLKDPDTWRRVALHSLAAGEACIDDGSGTCVDCGVALVACDDCGALGYHKPDCGGVA
jgi:hypothetical protein